ncbi:MAG: glycolate oxidase subunit GlcE [Steroidobacteraceae bacterium]
MDAAVTDLCDVVRAAAAAREPLRLRGGDTRHWLGGAVAGRELDLRPLSGIVSYEPSELVVTVRAGTRIDELEAELAARGQMLAFEPPRFAPASTVGGCIATGLAGPRRMARQPLGGAVRDHVLGVSVIDGRGGLLSFGGTVIKNVAGYDVSRMMVGSFGVLGILVDVSLKVLPRPVEEATLRFECDAGQALEWLRTWQARPLPLSGSVWCGGELQLRLSGASAAVAAARRELGGERVEATSWQALRDHQHPFFAGAAPLWRIAVPATAPRFADNEPELIEWGGMQRWLRSAQPAEQIRAWASRHGGHASCWRGGAPFMTPLPPAALAIQQRLKQQFDPAGILNPRRLFAEF